MSPEDDDLFGDPAPTKPTPKRRGRPRKTAPTPPPVDDPNVTEYDPENVEHLKEARAPDVSELMRPVGVTYLATLFGKEPRRLHKSLEKCRPVAYHNVSRTGAPQPLYDFKEALAYLIEPKLDVRAWLKAQNPAHLPVHINKAFWEAERARLGVMEKAGQLWHDEDVLDVLGRTALMIKETTQLWVEQLPGKADLTDEQYQSIQNNVAELLDEIHQRLVEAPKQRATESAAKTIENSLEDIPTATKEG